MKLTLISIFTIFSIFVKAGPLFSVSKVEILCNNSSIRDITKKIHVVSNAGFSVFADIGVQVKDASGNIIYNYVNINEDFYSPSITLTAGANYTINIVNGAGVTMRSNNGIPYSYNIVTPTCGIDVTTLRKYTEVKSDTKFAMIKAIDGKMIVSDGLLNGKKTILSKDEVLTLLSPIVSKESVLQTITIVANNNVANLLVELGSKNIKETLTVPLMVNDDGYLLIEETVTKTTEIAGKQTTKPVTSTLSRKHDYVGHVTLLR